MARKLRVEYAGAVYHLMSRGNGKQDIFLDAKDRKMFIKALGETCEKTGWRVTAFCLMGNHFHLCLETPQPNLVAGMKWLLGTYSTRFNKRHKRVGHLFAGRYKSLIVDGSNTGYLHKVCDYIHLNPVRSNLLTREQALKDYPWSSYPLYLLEPTQRPIWLEPRPLMGEKGVQTDNMSGRHRFEMLMEDRKLQELAGSLQDYEAIRKGWFYGEEANRRELLGKLDAAADENEAQSGVIFRESQRMKATDLLKELLRREKLSVSHLKQMRKGDPVKIKLAAEIRKRTTMSLKWTAEHLHMGSWTYVSNLLSLERVQKEAIAGTHSK
ncbi:transposase [bacterium]|nr:transposase [bacterium]MDA7652711.1 transposase [bacterium]MDA7660082.1 transposase [Verrucomicrobiota bacterium]